MAKLSGTDIKKAFEMFDSDNDGKIGGADWSKMQEVLKQQCKYPLNDMDYAEFESIGKELSKGDAECNDAMKAAFKALAGSKGHILGADMKKAMAQLGNPLSDKDYAAIVKEITKGKDKITFDDFKKAMQ